MVNMIETTKQMYMQMRVLKADEKPNDHPYFAKNIKQFS